MTSLRSEKVGRLIVFSEAAAIIVAIVMAMMMLGMTGNLTMNVIAGTVRTTRTMDGGESFL